jgi:ABC-type branched-subunit amino acid transport system substrate-binding protein
MFRGLSFALVLACFLTGPASGRAEDLVLGMSAAFTGPSRGLGIELYRGSMACFAEVNEAGGIHGRKIVIKAYDDGYDPKRALDNTRRLLDEDKVFLLYGYVGTPTVTRVLPLLKIQRKQTPFLFFPFTGAQPHRRAPYGDSVFNLRASYAQETEALVDNFVAVGRKKIAVFYQIDAYGRSGWAGTRAALAKHKLRLAGEATYKRGTPFSQSMTAQVEILRRSDPDAVICVGSYEACAAFVRDARDAGWNLPIANLSFVGSESLLDLLRAHGKEKGKDYLRDLINSEVVPDHDDLRIAAVKEYRRLMKKHKPPLPPGVADEDYQPLPHGSVSLEGYLNACLLVEVLRRLGEKPIPERIRATAESIEEFDLGIDLRVSFSSRRHQALDKVYLMVVERDRFVPLTSWTRWRK